MNTFSLFSRNLPIIMSVLVLGLPAIGQAQVNVVTGSNAVTGNVNISTQPAASSAGSYSITAPISGTNTTQNYTFGNGNEVSLDSFDTSLGTYQNVNVTASNTATLDVRVRRAGGSTGVNDPFSIVYESNSSSASSGNPRNIDLLPARRYTVEEVLENNSINVAVSDLHNNVPGGSPTSANIRAKNIERVDFIYNNGLSAKNAQQLEYGFLITDITTAASGVESAGIVAITGLDGSGDPASFANTVLRWTNTPGAIVSESTANQMIFMGNWDGQYDDPVLAADVNQGIYGRVVTLGDLGIGVNEEIFGFALVGEDTAQLVNGAGTSDVLLDWTDTTYFPLDTVIGDGHLDISGGSGVIYANSDASDFVNPEPALALAPLALLLCLFNRRFARRLR